MKPVRHVMNMFLESSRFVVLLVTQLFAIFVAPLIATADSQGLWFRIAVWSVLAASLYAASNRKAVFRIASILVLAVVYAWLGPDLFGARIDDLLRLVTIMVCFVFTAGVVLQAIVQHETVNRETLIGGINVYLLLGFAFMLAHACLEDTNPGAYTVHGEPLFAHTIGEYDGRALSTLLYFSFTTLTTLGYGDIVPVSDAARLLTSGEALVGQLYIAIFIGRLVGLEVGERTARRQAAAIDASDSDVERDDWKSVRGSDA